MVAPVELTRHIPVYRFTGTFIAVVSLAGGGIVASAAGSWRYPALGLLSLATLAIGCMGTIMMWTTKPVSMPNGETFREHWWHEYVFVNADTGKAIMTPAELDAAERVITWRFTGSSMVLGFVAIAALGVLLGVIALGYLNNPI